MAKPAKNSMGWMITFGDLMALLLTFFVLLFSFSTIDANKYEKMVRSMETAFGLRWTGVFQKARSGQTGKGIVQVKLPKPPLPQEKSTPKPTPKRATPPAIGKPMIVPPNARLEKKRRAASADDVVAARRKLYRRLAQLLHNQIAAGGVTVSATEFAVVIRFEEQVSFGTGRAQLQTTFAGMLDRIGPVLKRSNGQIVVVGHTDDRPISNQQFRSNWDLSSARAVSVVHYLLKHTGMRRDRIVAQGRADTSPIYPNDSEAHRTRNRRVEIHITNALDGTSLGGTAGRERSR